MATTTSSETLPPLRDPSANAVRNSKIRQQLLATRRQIASRFDMERSTLGTIEDEPMDPCDLASHEMHVSYSGDLGDLHRAQIRSIDEALERMSRGDYGLCEECGEPISTRRLQVQPEARLCIDCKDLEELTGAQYPEH